MDFLILCVLVLLYIYVGCRWHVYLVDSPPNPRYYNQTWGKRGWVCFCNVGFWWFFLLIFLFMLVYDYVTDPTMPSVKRILLHLMPYESWIRLMRWGALLGCIVLLATFGPGLRRQLRQNIEVEQPLTRPVATSNDTIRERPQVEHTRFEWYESDEIDN